MVRTVASTCWECASKCGSLITVEDDGRVSKIVPNTKSPVSKGAFCVKGMRALQEWTYHPNRLTHPMRRVGERGGGPWGRISWGEAFYQMADKMTPLRTQYPPTPPAGPVGRAAFTPPPGAAGR